MSHEAIYRQPVPGDLHFLGFVKKLLEKYECASNKESGGRWHTLQFVAFNLLVKVALCETRS